MRKHVIVVGAGPGGLACAKELAKGGFRVTLIDRHSHPGHKACAGGLPRSAWQLALSERDDTSAMNSFCHLNVISDLGRVELTHSEPLLKTFHRPEWTMAQLADLEALGVELGLGVRFEGIDGSVKTKIRTSTGSLDCDVLVGADGATSRVKAQLGLRPPPLRVIALQLILSKKRVGKRALCLVDTPTVWFRYRQLGSGYGWSFPCGDELRIGCGALAHEVDKKGLKAAFSSLLAEQGLSQGDGVVQSGSIGCDYSGHLFGPVRLVGDAAGLASPLTGEGIAQALLSGREVAWEILRPGYRSALIPKLAQKHRRTSNALAGTAVGRVAYDLAPMLLRSPWIKAETLKRYVF